MTSMMGRKAKWMVLAAFVLGGACAADGGREQSQRDVALGCQARSFDVEVMGQGPAMVFIPGLSSPGEVWRGTVEHYRAGHRCHVLTLKGFAGQPPERGALDAPLLERVVDDVLAYLREQRLQAPVVVGHSLGGIIGLALAARAPEQLGALAIVDALPFLPAAQLPGATPELMRPQAVELRAGLAAMSQAEYAAFVLAQPTASMVTSVADVARVQTWGLDSDPATVGRALHDVMVTDLRPQLARITAVTQVMGTYLGGVPAVTREQVLSGFQAQYQQLPGAQIVLSDRARHFVMLDDPAWLWQQLDALLARARMQGNPV
jgi:N-formylmaleamate deformylase